MAHDLSGSANHRRGPKRRLIRGAGGLALAAGAGAGGFIAVAGGSASAAPARARRAGFTVVAQRPTRAFPAVIGTVESVDAGSNSFTVKDPRGTTMSVDVSSTTTYRDRGVSTPSLSNVTVGEHVAVLGTTSSGTITATSVLIGGPRGWRGGPAGGPIPPVPAPGAPGLGRPGPSA